MTTESAARAPGKNIGYTRHCWLSEHNRSSSNSNNNLIKNKKEKTFVLINVAIPADRNVTRKEAKKKINARVYVQRYSECGT
jgi:hypothetical protein